MKGMPKNVIIGGGPAGMNAIETIRNFDSSSPITLISDEQSYARNALPRFLAKEISETQLRLGSDGSLNRLKVTRRDGRVTRVDTKAKRVELDGGGSVAYDNLLIATGLSPQRPPIEGASGKHVHNFWSLADAHALIESADMKRPSVVVVGAGFIALIIVSTLHKLGWKLSVVETGTQILPRMLDADGAQTAAAWLRDRGVDVYTGVTVTSIAGGRRKTIALSDGQQLTSHAVILSAGVKPNIGFLKGSGIKIDEGIIVDDHMQTNLRGVYAAGDVARGPNLLGGPNVIHPFHETAIEHGRIAGANMAGQNSVYAGSLEMRVLDIAGLHCASVGHWSDSGEATAAWDAEGSVYCKLMWDRDRLIGGVLVGSGDKSRIMSEADALRVLVRSRLELGSWKPHLQEQPWDLHRAATEAVGKPPAQPIEAKRAVAKRYPQTRKNSRNGRGQMAAQSPT
jgi:NAD(P)H-nitrite reductase large subunit